MNQSNLALFIIRYLFVSIIFVLLFFNAIVKQGVRGQNLKLFNTTNDAIFFRDTISDFVIDSAFHNLGSINPDLDARLVKHFKYIGGDSIYIEKTFTSDPHFICQYPRGVIIPNELYSLTICFFHKGRRGTMNKSMGFRMSNGEIILFRLKGDYRDA